MYQLSPEPNRFYRSLDFGSCQIRVHRINERYFPYPRHARNPGSSLRFLERHCYRRMVQPGSGMRHKHLAQSPLRRHRLEPRQPRHFLGSLVHPPRGAQAYRRRQPLLLRPGNHPSGDANPITTHGTSRPLPLSSKSLITIIAPATISNRENRFRSFPSERVFEKSRFCHISPTMFPHSSFQTAGANPGPRTVSLDLPGLFKHPLRGPCTKRKVLR
jgi:hypothetical protein